MRPIEWLGGRLKLLNQTELPHKEQYLDTSDYRQVIIAIKQLKVRGAPAIGIATAYGIALAGLEIKAADKASYIKQLDLIFKQFAAARPTAVNLFYAIDRMRQAVKSKNTVPAMREALLKTAATVHRQEDRAMAALSKHGAALIEDGFTVLTHCNTGQLATGVRYGPGDDQSSRRTGQKHLRLRRRNAPPAARLTFNCLGTFPAAHTLHAHHGQYGRIFP